MSNPSLLLVGLADVWATILVGILAASGGVIATLLTRKSRFRRRTEDQSAEVDLVAKLMDESKAMAIDLVNERNEIQRLWRQIHYFQELHLAYANRGHACQGELGRNMLYITVLRECLRGQQDYVDRLIRIIQRGQILEADLPLPAKPDGDPTSEMKIRTFDELVGPYPLPEAVPGVALLNPLTGKLD